MEIYARSSSSKEGRARRATAGPAMLKTSRSTREGRRPTAAASAMPRSLSSRSCAIAAGLVKEEEEEDEDEEEEQQQGGKAAAAATGTATATPRSFSSRCAGLVKEQRAKFYIMRRCVTMLICWRDYS